MRCRGWRHYYTFGFWIKTNNSNFDCETSFFTGPGCTGTATFAANIDGGPIIPNWVYQSVSIQAPANAVSFQVYCDTNDALFDKFILSPVSKF